jgi:hypothetical protein
MLRTAVTTYLPAMYIPDPTSPSTSASPPIRYLSTSSSQPFDRADAGIAKFDSPNYISGLPASLASLAVHPATPRADLTILALPLPLSHLSPAHFTSALSKLVPGVGKTIVERSRSLETRWDETDDEPYSVPGMGGRKAVSKTELSKEDIGSMYM